MRVSLNDSVRTLRFSLMPRIMIVNPFYEMDVPSRFRYLTGDFELKIHPSDLHDLSFMSLL